MASSATSSPAAEAWALMQRLFGPHRRRFMALAAEHELSPPQLGALKALDPDHPLAMSELAAVLGAALAARQRCIPVLLDGFVCTAAVAPLAKLRPDALGHALAGHVSAEAAHRMLLDELGLAPLLDLNMRLGEGSGAAVAVLVLRAALACHIGMATFAEAGVSGKS